jgi:hypothetical protein
MWEPDGPAQNNGAPRMDMFKAQFPTRQELMPAVHGAHKGLMDVAHGITGPAMESGFFGPGIAEQSKEYGRKRNESFNQALEQNPGMAKFGQFAGQVTGASPAALVPGGGAGFLGYLRNILQNAGIGGALAATEYQENPENRLEKGIRGAGTAAAVSAVLPVVGKAIQGVGSAYKGIRKQMGSKEHVAEDVFQGLLPSERAGMSQNQAAAKKVGVQITPAEASGNPILAAREAQYGVTPETQMKKYEFKKGQKGKQEGVISKFLQSISPKNEVANEEVRGTAKRIIDKKIVERQAKAAPIYAKAESELVPQQDVARLIADDPNIKKAFKQVGSDPLYQKDLKGFDTHSIKSIDLVKRNLDDKIDSAMRAGEKNKARILMDSKKSLVEMMDAKSPTYQKARKIYADDSPAIKALQDSKIGRLANKSDEQLKNITKDIFDISQTDPKVFNAYRDALQKENPLAWNAAVRDEMMRRMKGSRNLGKTSNYGSEFFDKILASDRDFNQFLEALGKSNQKAYTPNQEMLINMRKAFQNLVNSRTVKTAGGQSEVNMLESRNTGSFLRKAAAKMFGGKYDKAAIDIITDPNWERYVPASVQKTVNMKSPSTEDMVKILSAVAAKRSAEE